MPEQYQSALTGPQMDQALLDMANHTSERYAKGTANGAAVPSGTAGYHDNALYYKDLAANQAQTATNAAGSATNSAAAASTSEASATTAAGTATSAATTATQQATRAQNAADRAEAIVGGQFVSYGQTQGLTDAQKATARDNIGAGAGEGGGGSNILDNGWLTINQREFVSVSSPSADTYTVDRWFVTAQTDLTVSLSNSGLTINNQSSSFAYFSQRIQPIRAVGKPITISVMKSDGSIYSATLAAVPARTAASQTIINSTLAAGLAVRFVYGATSDAYDTVQVVVGGGTGIIIRAVKLEIGAASTLANDTAPNFASELAKCQYYCRVVNLGSISADILFGRINNTGYMAIFASIAGLGVPMAKKGSELNITYTGSWNIVALPSGTSKAVSSISYNNDSYYPSLTVNTTTGGNAYSTCVLRSGGSNSKLIISADL